ncbi:carbohydrate ABC transporter permease [Microbacterium lushaniae]|uniref:Carbohydrate ABC transporter permease n=1 Tax=Microbacterium lushaniae TaxID=2614639 RepID=A0A5J5JMD3_9MICO|nr:carbohydrate ABC transporter permease [Microbacterium lushaniae]KAA9154905.1 carbohydrate ABC transporter permease [Microbacterium lushaniae]KAA9155343.1 carbohydrate ABC transporter permease [Microbacterium lushaniae]QEW03083.1 carbohydrate ABC transporter permease [Microbacterium lushaniae]
MRRVTTVLLGLLLFSLALACALPFGLMFLTSFRTTTNLALSWDFSAYHLDNYVTLFTTHSFLTRILTTVAVVVIACTLNVVTATMAAFGLSKKPFPGSKAVFWVIIATMMVPVQVTLVPLYTIMRELGLLNTHLGLALPIVTGFGVFLMKQFADGLPDEIIEAARIDGAPDRMVLLRIAVPLMKPVITALLIFTFLAAWNDFLWPLVSISQDQMQTVTYAIANLEGRSTTNYGLLTAGATVSFLGPFIAYVILQRRFVEGIALTGTKG